MREDIMYVIVYPNGLIIMNTQKYYRSFCIENGVKDAPGHGNNGIRWDIAVKK